MSEQDLSQSVVISEQDVQRFITAQARVACSKANRNAGLEVEDFVSLGYEVFVKAKSTWKADQNTKFSTYFTMCLQREFYKKMRDTHAKKRGGAGDKAADLRHGRSERWENGDAEKEVAHLISLSVPTSTDNDGQHATIQLEAQTDTSVEYNLLIKQMMKVIPTTSRMVFKQMVDPDPELLEMAAKRVDAHINPAMKDKPCAIDNQMLADYLKMDVSELRLHRRRIEILMKQKLGVR